MTTDEQHEYLLTIYTLIHRIQFGYDNNVFVVPDGAARYMLDARTMEEVKAASEAIDALILATKQQMREQKGGAGV